MLLTLKHEILLILKSSSTLEFDKLMNDYDILEEKYEKQIKENEKDK